MAINIKKTFGCLNNSEHPNVFFMFIVVLSYYTK